MLHNVLKYLLTAVEKSFEKALATYSSNHNYILS